MRRTSDSLAPLLGFCLLLLSTSATLARQQPNVPASAAADSPEMAATIRMVSAHATLRSPEVADPDSDSNRRLLDVMLRKALVPRPALPPPPPQFPAPATPLVGTLEGKFSVDNKGIANYDITLPVPAGRSGFEPDLGVSYFSGGGDGVLGSGFSFSTGFYRSIDRGRTIMARDGFTRSAELDPSDNFYLDGKRLVCVSAPQTRGRPGCVYRTEVDSFAEITALGDGDEITGFRLRDRHGRTYHFGQHHGTDDAFQRYFDENTGALDPRAFNYALKRVEDPLGNYIEFTYTHRGLGDWVLDEIRYTGGPAVPPTNALRFVYSERPQRRPHYYAFRRADSNQRLDCIRAVSLSSGTVVSEYKFEYDSPGANHALHLAAIQAAFAAQVGAPLLSLPPTRFRWSRDHATAASARSFALPAPTTPTAGAFGDFDHDGKADLLDAHDGLRVALSSTTGLAAGLSPWADAATVNRQLGEKTERAVFLGDFDGNGLTDALLAGANGKLCFFRSTGSRFVPLSTLDQPDLAKLAQGPGGAPAAFSRVCLGDFNGDGREDLLVHAPAGTLHPYLSNGSTFTSPAGGAELRRITTDSGTAAIQSLASDLNNDGVDDYIWLEQPAAGTEASPRLRYVLTLPDGGFSAPVTIHEWAAGCGDRYALISGEFSGDDAVCFLTGEGGDGPDGWRWTLHVPRCPPTRLPAPTVPTFTHHRDALPPSWILPQGGRLAIRGTPPVAVPASAPTALLTRLPRSFGVDHGANLIALDINGDYCADLVWYGRPETTDGTHSPDTPGWWACLSNRNGAFSPPQRLVGTPWESVPPPETAGPVLVTRAHDINGDGIMDWVVARQADTPAQTLVAVYPEVADNPEQCPFPNLVTDIVDGQGRTTSIGYKAAKDDSVYTPGAPVEFPIIDLRQNSPVVSELWKDSAGGSPAHFSYGYGALRLDFAGRGGLGFGCFTTLDQQTGFVKFQFLEHSFPMTGLTAREQTYWFWQRDGQICIEEIKSEDYANSFDAVVDPASGRLFGTLHPYLVRTIETRWRTDEKADFTYPAAASPVKAGRKPIFGTPAKEQLLAVTTTTHWRDNQKSSAPPSTRQPQIAFPYVLSPDYDTPAARRTPPAATLFPGKITYGNEYATHTADGFGSVKEVTKTFRAPRSPDDPLTSLVESEASRERSTGSPDEVGPLQSFRYFANTTLLACKTVDARKTTGDGAKVLTETTYDRDPRGRVTLRRSRTVAPDGTETGNEVQYTASAFDDLFDLATEETEEPTGRMLSTYHPIFLEWTSVTFDNGTTTTAEHDGLGRQIMVCNPGNDYLKTTTYAWTGASDEGWRQMQRVNPPSGVTGIQQTSVYAVRIATSGKPTTTTYYDRISRIIRVSTEATDGTISLVDTVYNSLGQVVATSKPHEPDGDTTWELQQYDGYGNVSRTSEILVKRRRSGSPR